MGQFSNSFPKHFSYPCEYAIRCALSCSFCEYPFIFHCLHCSPSCFDPDSLLLAYPWLGLSWIDCISANKSFSSSKTSSRKPYTSSKQLERHKHSVEITLNLSATPGAGAGERKRPAPEQLPTLRGRLWNPWQSVPRTQTPTGDYSQNMPVSWKMSRSSSAVMPEMSRVTCSTPLFASSETASQSKGRSRRPTPAPKQRFRITTGVLSPLPSV